MNKKEIIVKLALLAVIFALSVSVAGLESTLTMFAIVLLYAVPPAIIIGGGVFVFFWSLKPDELKTVRRALGGAF